MYAVPEVVVEFGIYFVVVESVDADENDQCMLKNNPDDTSVKYFYLKHFSNY